ncbi:unnamed protein product, partial [Rotaria sp. Silwood2]
FYEMWNLFSDKIVNTLTQPHPREEPITVLNSAALINQQQEDSQSPPLEAQPATTKQEQSEI